MEKTFKDNERGVLFDFNGTLLFDKSTIDPAIEANEVYDRDVWTPTFKDNLQIDYEINDDAIETVADNLGIEEWRLRDAV